MMSYFECSVSLSNCLYASTDYAYSKKAAYHKSNSLHFQALFDKGPMQIFVLLLVLPSSSAIWECPTNPILPNNAIVNTFPSGNDWHYGHKTNCQIKIYVPPGMFASMTVSTNPGAGDLIKGENQFINVEFPENAYKMTTVGEDYFTFTINSPQNSVGTFQTTWVLRNVSFDYTTPLTLIKGQQPIVVQTYELFQAPRTITSQIGDSIAISTAPYGRVAGDDYTLSGAFVYLGNSISGTPYKCLFTQIGEQAPLVIANTTVTLVFLTSERYDVGAFAINSYSDVQKYSQYQFLYYANLGTAERFVVDATNGTAAVTLYQDDASKTCDLVKSYILQYSSQNISLFSGGLPLSSKQLMTTYGVYSSADNAMPQWMPDRLKTFYLTSGTVSIITDPQNNGTLTANADQVGFFKSANYPFSDSKQDITVNMISDVPLTLTVTCVVMDSQTSIIVNTTGIQNPGSCRFTASGQNCSIYGTNFQFSSTSTTSPSTGGLVNYQFTGNGTTATNPSSSKLSFIDLPFSLLSTIFIAVNKLF